MGGGGGGPDFVYFSFFNFRVGTYNLPPGSSDSASPQRGAKPRVAEKISLGRRNLRFRGGGVALPIPIPP